MIRYTHENKSGRVMRGVRIAADGTDTDDGASPRLFIIHNITEVGRGYEDEAFDCGLQCGCENAV